MIKRIIGIGDIHGSLDLLIEMVERQIKFNPKTDKLVFLGDFIDRGHNSKKVVTYLQNLKKKYPDNIVLLMGNHEDLALAYLTQGEEATLEERLYARMWLANGGDATIRNFGGGDNCRKLLVPFIQSLELFHAEDDFIFVHAGLPKKVKDIRKADKQALIWDRDIAYQGSKTLVVGHNIVDRVTKVGQYIMLDTGAFLSGVLSAYDVLNDKVYQAVDPKRVVKEKAHNLFGEMYAM